MPLDAQTLQALHRICRREWARAAREDSVSLSEFDYLQEVYEQEELQRYEDRHGQHLHDIVEALEVTKASASAMIAKLEARGLVERFQCKGDARAQHIILTAAGRARLQDGLAVYARAVVVAEAALRDRGDDGPGAAGGGGGAPGAGPDSGDTGATGRQDTGQQDKGKA